MNNQKVRWIVPTRIENENDLLMLRKCLTSIITHFPDPSHEILVVDSNSPMRTHLDEQFMPDRITYADIKNTNYEAGALYYGVNNYDADYYVLFHDSEEVLEPFTDAFTGPLVNCIWYMGGWHALEGVGIDWAKQQLRNSHWALKMTEDFAAVCGSSCIIRADVIKELVSLGLDKILPTNKFESMAFERIFGMILCISGYRDYITATTLAERNKILKHNRGRL